jgi:hypothetical protein
VNLGTFYLAAHGAYAPGPHNIEDSYAITKAGYDRVHHSSGFADL